MNPEIFKAYDIRGVYPDDLNGRRPDVRRQLGMRFTSIPEMLRVMWTSITNAVYGIPSSRARKERVRTGKELLRCCELCVKLCKATHIPEKVQRRVVLAFVRACWREISRGDPKTRRVTGSRQMPALRDQTNEPEYPTA